MIHRPDWIHPRLIVSHYSKRRKVLMGWLADVNVESVMTTVFKCFNNTCWYLVLYSVIWEGGARIEVSGCSKHIVSDVLAVCLVSTRKEEINHTERQFLLWLCLWCGGKDNKWLWLIRWVKIIHVFPLLFSHCKLIHLLTALLLCRCFLFTVFDD